MARDLRIIAGPSGILLAIFIVILSWLIIDLAWFQTLNVLGFFRTPANTILADPSNLIVIPGTRFCEDLHYHEPSGQIFTACEDSDARYSWFPPLGILDSPKDALVTQGKLQVIDAATMKSRRLLLQGFHGPFVTHGIDIIADPTAAPGAAVYIFAINHVPVLHNGLDCPAPASTETQCDSGTAQSQIEVFHHWVGSDVARHVRSISHPFLTTPNDILLLNETSFLVTNDHYYRNGLMRHVEDVFPSAKWSNLIHVSLAELSATDNSTTGVEASVALKGLHNKQWPWPLWLPGRLLITSAASGAMHFAKSEVRDDDLDIHVVKSIQFTSTIDNPTFFSDPYKTVAYDASGIVVAGLTKGADLSSSQRNKDAKHPSIVWFVKNQQSGNQIEDLSTGTWEMEVLFEDDGTRASAAATALLVAIDPALENRERKAWLFVTGFLSKNVIAVKVAI